MFLLVGFQKTKAQLSIVGGAQVTSAKYMIREVKQSTESKPGFMAGAAYTTWIEGTVYFSPMLYYSQKGYKASFDRPAFPPDSNAINNDVSVHAIEMAPLIQVNFSKKPSFVFLHFGPAFDFNISGKEQFDTADNQTVSRKMKFSFADYSYATISFNGHLGYQHKNGFSFFAYYNYGVSSLNNADLGPSIYHRVAGVSMGWRFGKRK